MQYLLMLYEDEAAFGRRSGPDSYMEAYRAYTVALREAGAIAGGAALMPPHTATTLKVRDGKRHVQDGPFADTKEQLGGYYLIEAPDLDAAMGWAAKCPCADYGTVEVRPIWPNPGA
jgi:hypothetical protein